MRVKLVEAADSVLLAFDETLRQRALETLLARNDKFDFVGVPLQTHVCVCMHPAQRAVLT